MGADKMDLVPAQQCTETDSGHFGELLKEVYQDGTGVLAREQTWTSQQWSGLDHELMSRRGNDERQDPGPYNKTFLDMAFGGDLYTLGQDTKTLSINGKPVETGSAQYTEATAKMDKALQSIDLNAPACDRSRHMGFYENLD